MDGQVGRRVGGPLQRAAEGEQAEGLVQDSTSWLWFHSSRNLDEHNGVLQS